MPKTFEEVERDAMELSEAERAKLANNLIASIEEDEENIEIDPKIERAWMDEVARRIDAYDKGLIKAIPADEASAEVKRRLKHASKISPSGDG
ncbi:MAG: addiction module protein [Planctomycetes bacterium]|nr:addiction module protein [Planctomycetota bacterium]